MAQIRSADFEPLAHQLHQIAQTRPLCYLANPGTWGAALTRDATLCFFRSIHLDVEEIQGVSPWQLLRGRFRKAALLYGGGGAWGAEFGGGRDLVSRALLGFREVVVLPSTFGTPFHRPNCHLWARDRFTSLQLVPHAHFCHDLGLFPREVPAIRPRESRGNFFRNDALASSSTVTGPDPRLPDLSSQGTERSPLRPFLETIGQYEEIHTDRVHVAIAGCLLGRSCHVYPTQSPLLGDLFASSLGPFFPKAVWHGEPLPA